LTHTADCGQRHSSSRGDGLRNDGDESAVGRTRRARRKHYRASDGDWWAWHSSYEALNCVIPANVTDGPFTVAPLWPSNVEAMPLTVTFCCALKFRLPLASIEMSP